MSVILQSVSNSIFPILILKSVRTTEVTAERAVKDVFQLMK
jgi:hypothetical protein